VGKAVDEFMRFLSPSRATDLGAARRDLIEALQRYLESERVGPGGLTPSGSIFEVEMLHVVRKHAMTLAPDAVRYLKAVLTAEAMVRELDPAFDLRAHENRFFARLMQVELAETLSLGRAAQWLLTARRRLDRALEPVESVQEPAARLLALNRQVRRQVQVLSALTIAGWLAVLAAMWSTAAPLGVSSRAHPWLGLAVGVAGVILLVCSIRQVRRLPRESAAEVSGRHPLRRGPAQ
jgi:hypothetical protein